MNLEPIDTSTTAGKVEVMRLAAEGRKVAGKSRSDEDDWFRVVEPTWNWGAACFAIIAEPVGPDEVWVAVNALGGPFDASENKGDMEAVGKAIRYIRADLAGADQ